MKLIEIRAKEITDTAWYLAQENGAEFYQKKSAVYETCDFCNCERGIGYVYWKDGKIMCIWCEIRGLFKD